MVVLNTDIQTEEKPEFLKELSYEEAARKVCEEVLRQEAFDRNAEISLVIADPDEVHRLNLEFRGIDATTDVLSFPALEYEEPGDYGGAVDFTCIDPDNGCVMLGDIVINAQKVREQALEYGHSELREFAFLIAHSMLHLCGYDHMTPQEAQEMDKKQEKVLEALGITREL